MNSENTVLIAKGITKLVVSRSVSGVVVTALHNVTPTHDKAQKAQLYIGAYVVGAMVADKAVDYATVRVETAIAFAQDFKSMLSKKKTKSTTE